MHELLSILDQYVLEHRTAINIVGAYISSKGPTIKFIGLDRRYYERKQHFALCIAVPQQYNGGRARTELIN